AISPQPRVSASSAPAAVATRAVSSGAQRGSFGARNDTSPRTAEPRAARRPPDPPGPPGAGPTAAGSVASGPVVSGPVVSGPAATGWPGPVPTVARPEAELADGSWGRSSVDTGRSLVRMRIGLIGPGPSRCARRSSGR